jgi:ribonuclease R
MSDTSASRTTHTRTSLRRFAAIPIFSFTARSRQCSAGKPYTPSGQSWDALGVHCSMTERRADDASRDVTQWLKCFYMQDRIGEEFDGTISGIASFGLFVTLDGLNIDGLVHVTELGRDYFHFQQARHALIGEKSGRTFQLAGRVRVRVVRVDLETAKIDFTLAEVGGACGAATPLQRAAFAREPAAPARKKSGADPSG